MNTVSKRPRIAYVGMTHLGLNSAVAAAEKGFDTVGFDPNADLIGQLNRGELPVIEPDLPELLTKNSDHITFTSNVDDLGACEVVYVAPDVPTDDKGQSDLSSLDRLIDLAADSLAENGVLVVLSQVPPGFTRQRMRPGLTLFYQVETLVFGRAIERALYPERYIVGCANPSDPLPEALQAYLATFDCPILPMRFESAELTKIAINCCLVSSISVANTLSELCEGIDAVWSEIAPALKLDKRIGQYSYLTPGLGIAGGNLERDLATVIRMSEGTGGDSDVVKAWVSNSRHRRDWAARTARKVILDPKPNARIAIWGLAYKENTHSVKNSPSLATIAQLPDADLVLHDPVVPAKAAGHEKSVQADTPLSALSEADALMILTPWPDYKKISTSEIAAAMTGKIVLDPYAVLNIEEARAAGLDYHTLGRSNAV